MGGRTAQKGAIAQHRIIRGKKARWRASVGKIGQKGEFRRMALKRPRTLGLFVVEKAHREIGRIWSGRPKEGRPGLPGNPGL